MHEQMTTNMQHSYCHGEAAGLYTRFSLQSVKLKMPAAFLLLVVKPMSYCSLLIHFKIMVLLVSDRGDHYRMPNSVVLTLR